MISYYILRNQILRAFDIAEFSIHILTEIKRNTLLAYRLWCVNKYVTRMRIRCFYGYTKKHYPSTYRLCVTYKYITIHVLLAKGLFTNLISFKHCDLSFYLHRWLWLEGRRFRHWWCPSWTSLLQMCKMQVNENPKQQVTEVWSNSKLYTRLYSYTTIIKSAIF